MYKLLELSKVSRDSERLRDRSDHWASRGASLLNYLLMKEVGKRLKGEQASWDITGKVAWR